MSLVVVDLEATCWTPEEDPGLAARQRQESEVIEIGAVLLDPDSLEERASFQTFVRPTRHPTLSPFCTRLTTIPQDQVEAAPVLPEAWHTFLVWMGGDDGTELCSWGAYDGRQLALEAKRHGLPAPTWTTVNLKRRFAEAVRRLEGRRPPRIGLSSALAHLGWTFEGTPHRALSDARNAARILRWLSEHRP